MTKQEYAVIDMGTNSLRLMTGWKDESRDRWVLSPKQVETTRLGLHAEQTGRLSEAGMQASFAVLERWRSRLAQVPVCVVATSAVREAKDGKAFWRKYVPVSAGIVAPLPVGKRRPWDFAG